MSTQNSLTRISTSVVQASVEYAKRTCGITLSGEMLAHLYDKARMHRTKTNCTFREARSWALTDTLSERDQKSQERFQAYSRALGKMGNLHRQLSGRPSRPPRKRTARERLQEYVKLGRDGRQYEFIL